MSRRASHPSERVQEILDGDRAPRVLQLPSTLAQGRYGVSRQAIIGVVLVVAVAVAMLGGRYLLARGESAPEPVGVEEPGEGAPFAPSGTGPPTAADGAATAPAAAPPSPTEVTVHVVGQVKRPGVVSLPAGSRVTEALEEAGGETSTADLTGVNLARPLVDGEQVVVPEPGESPVPAAPGTAGAGGAPAAPGGSSQVNLNTADLTTLETLPGVGPVLGQRILDWRAEHGQFTAVEELGEVSGVGEKTYAQLAPMVTV
ncbi:helix-hairpin-helix domain-containing protein [Janibacter sp. GS2]|uniref:helix-hairpin-helix domain-containing protein n=1 Tax=Janibacter sp. GS2 TaxID=3442646 RepID=UPI003EBECB1C